MKLRTILLLVVVLVVACAGLIGWSFYLALAPGPDTLAGSLQESMQALAFSPDGTTLVVGDAVGQIKVWDVATRHERRKALGGHLQPINSLSFSPDGQALVSGGDDGVFIWDMISGVEAGQLADGPRAGQGAAARAVAEQPDGAIARVTAAYSPDGKTIAHAGKRLVLWDVAARKERFATDKSGPVRAVRFTPDGKRLATAGGRGIVLWDVETGKETAVVYERGKDVVPNDVAFSPDGKTVAWAGDDHDVYLWDVEGRKEIGKLSGHTDRVLVVAFHPDGRLLASGDQGEQTFLWNVESQKQVTFRQQTYQSLIGNPGGPVTGLVFSPDGKLLASAGGPLVKVWEVAKLAK